MEDCETDKENEIMNPINQQGYDLMHAGALALVDVETHGVRVDVPYYKEQSAALIPQIVKSEQDLLEWDEIKEVKRKYGKKFSLGSDLQIHHLVFDICGIEETEDIIGVDSNSLRHTGLLFVDELLHYRKLTQTKSTFIDPFIREAVLGRIYNFFTLHRPRSFRGASEKINFQNFPVRDKIMGPLVRSGIFPDIGHQLLEIDFKGNEVRVGNAYHLDPKMTEYNSDFKKDMHRDQGEMLFCTSISNISKDVRFYITNMFVFPQFYGSWFDPCAKNLWKNVVLAGLLLKDGTSVKDFLKNAGIVTLEQFIAHVQFVEDKFWNERFSIYKEWKEINWNGYVESGEVDLLSGFTCRGIMNKKQCNNYPVQGSAFHCLLWCLIELNKYIKNNGLLSRIIGQIHDSIVLSLCPFEFEQIINKSKEIMEEKIRKFYPWLIVPMIAEYEITRVNRPWATKKEIAV